MLYSENIKDYYLLDAGDSEKLEVWGPYILRRPDPMAIWKKQKDMILNTMYLMQK